MNLILREKRQRWFEALGRERKRSRFLVRLTDPRDFDHDHMVNVTVAASNIEGIEKMRISQWATIDASSMLLTDALQRSFGIGLGSVISCAGRLCFYESEMPNERWLLVKASWE